MIVDKIYEYLEGKGRPLPRHVVEFALKRMERTARRNLGEQEERTRPRQISGSTAWSCPRKAYYQITGAEQELVKGRSRMAFLMGDTLQACIDVLAKQAGVEFEYPDANGDELELRAQINGVEVVGHVDHALRTSQDGLLVVDTKSMAQYSFDEFSKACQDPEADWLKKERWGYLAQVRFYAWLIRRLGLGTGERSLLVAVCKNTGLMAELVVPRCEETEAVFERAIPRLDAARRQYMQAREAVIATVVSNGGTLQEAEAAASIVPRTEATGLLPRATWAKTKEVKNVKLPDGTRGNALEVDTDPETTQHQGWRCSYCPWIAQCFQGFEVVALGKPVWRKALPK